MLRGDSTINALVLAAAAAIAIAYFVPRHIGGGSTVAPSVTTPAPQAGTAPAPAQPRNGSPAPAAQWASAAPGRVEPNGGEIRISAQMPGRIVDVLAQVGDKVGAGELLVRLEDAELEARLLAAEAEVSVRKRERDGETVGKPAQDRRAAEDALFNAERALSQARSEFDRVARSRRLSNTAVADSEKSRQAVSAARERVDAARAGLRKAQTVENVPAQTRLESALAASRAEWSIADAALERTRIRAPKDVSVLQVMATAGESVAPSPEATIAVLGDVRSLRVRAEIEERDAGKVKSGQIAIVRSDAFPGREFEGKVASYAQALGPSRMGQKGPRKTTDVDVLEVFIELEGQPPLLPGMRVDVFLKPEAVAKTANRS